MNAARRVTYALCCIQVVISVVNGAWTTLAWAGIAACWVYIAGVSEASYMRLYSTVKQQHEQIRDLGGDW